ncbi:MAG: hypothetical protein BAJATHORv1_50004 [Candidatus Thorarchaeota archaeon]|nr:MAG: hypothetical protein BAJATHORv1_50004 [Candidatus Thorarchaeota archaeon]
MKQYFVFMCSKCHRFTLAPVGQKRRRCSYCGSFIDIKKVRKALYETPQEASAAVREYNAQRDDKFQKVAERSREKILKLVPKERIEVEDIVDEDGQALPTGKSKRLMTLLEREAKGKGCTLDHIEEVCSEYQLDWPWVEGQLNKLANAGVLIFPRPWKVKLVRIEQQEEADPGRKVDVSKDIVKILHERGGPVDVEELIHNFTDTGISESSVEDSLEKLMRTGEIFEPKPGVVQLI